MAAFSAAPIVALFFQAAASFGSRDIGGQAMPTGTIARLLIDKGFGFIRDESGLEHFFHRSSVRGAVFELLREGQRVEFSVEESQKGPRAGDVRLIEG
jgi:CspA family cold shock protein